MPSIAVVNHARLPVHDGALRRLCDLWADGVGVDVTYAQVEDESSAKATIDDAMDRHDGVILNAHDMVDSPALAEYVRGLGKPIVSVDLTGPAQYRRTLLGESCDASIHGRGLGGYKWAMTCLVDYLAWPYTVVAYGDGVDQTAEVRLPEGSGPFPVVVLLHGGSWRDQWRRDIMSGPSVDLARNGFASVNLEFRRVGASGGGWPGTFEDVADGIDHLASLSDSFDLDPARVAVVGHSSGGHLALWAACRDQLPDGVPGSGPEVMPRLAISQAGMVDLFESARRGTAEGDRAVADFLGGFPDDDPEVYRMVSPATYIPLNPRIVLVQGLLDNNADLVDFNRAFAEASGAELLEFEDGDHFSVIDPEDRSWTMTLAEIERALT